MSELDYLIDTYGVGRDVPEPDIDSIREAWQETYLDECKTEGKTPSEQDFDEWLEKRDYVWEE